MPDEQLWVKLGESLERMAAGFPGVAGISVRDLARERSLGVNQSEVFPTASTIKIHILLRLLDLELKGQLDLDEMIQVSDLPPVPGSGVLNYLDGEVSLSRRDVAVLMIIASDNLATNLCIDWAGIEATNRMLEGLGLKETRLRRKMQDYRAVAEDRENVSTPEELTSLLAGLYRGEKFPAPVIEEALRILKKPKKSYLARGLPPDAVVAGKPGAMDRVRCDAGIVYQSRRPYAVAVMTKFGLVEPREQEDFLAEVTAAVHRVMSALDQSSGLGQGIPLQPPEA